MKQYDIAVVGAGPAGYVAAIRGAQLGFTVVCIDGFKDASGQYALGGTCLNVGCIPSKTLLETSYRYYHLRNKGQGEGIVYSDLSIDVVKMMERKDGIVKNLTSGIAALLRSNGVTVIHGQARVIGGNSLEITQPNEMSRIMAKHIVLATGSAPIELPFALFDSARILDSSGALSLRSVPKKLVIIGAGVIGLELGSVWCRLGSDVTIVEALPEFLPTVDREVSKKTLLLFKKQGLDIRLGTQLKAAEVTPNGVRLTVDSEGTNSVLETDVVVVAVGRRPCSQGLCAEEVGVVFDERGFAVVDAHCKTAVDSIYAIGDLVRGPMLAHKGSEEGVMVVERLAGEHTEINYENMPNVIYTHPEIAWSGKTEQQLQAAGVSYKVGVFPLAASGRAMANNSTEGFVKTLIEEVTNRILGVHIVAEHAGELLAQAVSIMEFGAVAEDVAMTVFAHPTLSETLKESALASLGHALHVAKKK